MRRSAPSPKTSPGRAPRPPIVRAWLVLAWERLARVLWPALAFPLAFLALALLGVWEFVGDPWRLLAGVAALGAAGFFAWAGLRRGRWPWRRAALRRIETDSGLAGRPFDALRDRPAGGASDAEVLWRTHQDRMRIAAEGARVRGPRAAFAAIDPFGLRFVGLAGLAIAAIIGGPAGLTRLGEATSTDRLIGARGIVSVQAWIEPPAHTGRPPMFLDVREGDDVPGDLVSAPTGSVLVVRAPGARRAPVLRIATEDRTQRLRFAPSGPGAYEARHTITADARIDTRGGARGGWRIAALPDRAPQVAFTDGPSADDRQALAFAYEFTDDYGVTDLRLRIAPRDGAPVEHIAVSAPTGASGGERIALDLTGHRLAGTAVALTLVATDGAAQTGESRPAFLDLPERVFIDPLARAIAENRVALMRASEAYAPVPPLPPLDAAALAARPRLGDFAVAVDDPERRIARAPEVVRRVRRGLDLVLVEGERFGHDPIVHAALTYVARRIAHAADQADLDGLPALLWSAAERAEGGDLASAAKALAEAQERLARALARGAPEAEIRALMQAFETAVERYMAALLADALARGEDALAGAGGPADLGADQLEEMLRALRDLAETGAAADARRLLAALGELLANLQLQLAAGGGGGDLRDQLDPETREALERLGDAISRQRELMDQTQGAADGAPAPEAGELAADQGALADGAGELAGENPSGAAAAVAEAEGAMRAAEDALAGGDLPAALDAQGEAVDALRRGAEAAAREILEASRSGEGRDGAAQGGRDPFGRPLAGAGVGPGDDVAIPDAADRQRARDILDELRRRAAETEREDEERGYIDRLLDRF